MLIFVICVLESCFNLDLDSIITPLDVTAFEDMLIEANYDAEEMRFLLDGFTNGFDIGYQGPSVCQSYSENIPLSVGTNQDLWDKIMKEVRAGRVAGPFDSIPFENFIQSPVGLVPKAGGKTRMIFHLSHNFNKVKGVELLECEKSLNSCTPKYLCTVKYNDLDCAVTQCLNILRQVEAEKATSRSSNTETNDDKAPVLFLGKTDLMSTFRVLPLKLRCLCWLVFKARDPKDKKFKFFVDKCLPFGASISCSHYQHFSNALKHLLQHRVGH